MKKPGALANALRNSGATVAATPSQDLPPAPEPQAPGALSRQGTKPITVHFPVEVRRQLKSLAAEEDRSMEDMTAEAFNLLFARYRRPEIAPRKAGK